MSKIFVNMSVHLSVGFSVEPYAVVRILVEHLLSYGNEVSYTIIKPGAKFPVKHRAFLYVILSEPPKKTSTEFYINP